MQLLDEIYNYGPGKRCPLKYRASEVMRERHSRKARVRKNGASEENGAARSQRHGVAVP
jgi:hypothetical protein